MVTPQLLDYIRQCLVQGMSKEQVIQSLRAIGWQKADIMEGLTSVSQEIKTSGQQFLYDHVLAPAKVTTSFVALAWAVIVFLFAGAAFVHFYYIEPATPQIVVARMAQNIKSITSVTYRGTIRAQFDVNDVSNLPGLGGVAGLFQLQSAAHSQGTSLVIKIQGASDAHTPDKPKGFFIFDASLIAPPEEQFFLGGEVRVNQNVVFARLTELSSTAYDEFLNKWIRIEPEVFPQELGQTPALSNYQRREALLASDVIQLTHDLGDTALQGKPVHHYAYLFNKKAFSAFLSTAYQFSEKELANQDQLRDIQSALDYVDVAGGELWIGKDDLLPHRISFTITIKTPRESGVLAALLTTLDFSDFNKPVTIESPSFAMSADELILPSLIEPSLTE